MRLTHKVLSSLTELRIVVYYVVIVLMFQKKERGCVKLK